MNGSSASWTPRVERQLRTILASLPDDQDAFRQACRNADDWTALLSSALDHGVAGVVLKGAAHAGIVPPQAASEMAERWLRPRIVWQDVLRSTLRIVLTTLAEQGVAAVSLKGPILAARLYDDEALRPSIDLDVLVDPASLDAAVLALHPLGYVLEGGRLGKFFRDEHHHVHLFHPTLPVVELHFDAYRGFGTALPAAPLLARSISCDLPDWRDARVPAPEDEFLYLAVHAASHRFQRLGWLYDLKLLAMRHPELRWDQIAERAEIHRLSAVASFACALLSEWLGTPRYGSGHLPALGKARAAAAVYLTQPQPMHVVNATADFLFCALLCDDRARVVALLRRFVRMKVCYEAPRRVRELFSAAE